MNRLFKINKDHFRTGNEETIVLKQKLRRSDDK